MTWPEAFFYAVVVLAAAVIVLTFIGTRRR